MGSCSFFGYLLLFSYRCLLWILMSSEMRDRALAKCCSGFILVFPFCSLLYSKYIHTSLEYISHPSLASFMKLTRSLFKHRAPFLYLIICDDSDEHETTRINSNARLPTWAVANLGKNITRQPWKEPTDRLPHAPLPRRHVVDSFL